MTQWWENKKCRYSIKGVIQNGLWRHMNSGFSERYCFWELIPSSMTAVILGEYAWWVEEVITHSEVDKKSIINI